MLMHHATNLLLMLFGLGTLAIMIAIGKPASGEWWLYSIGYLAWAALPYAILWVMNNIVIEEERLRDIVLLVSTVIICGWAVYAAVDALMIDPNPMPEAMFVSAPKWQSLIAVAGGVLAFLMPKSKSKTAI